MLGPPIPKVSANSFGVFPFSDLCGLSLSYSFSPDLDEQAGLLERSEPLRAETLSTKPGVERLDEAFCTGFPGSIKHRSTPCRSAHNRNARRRTLARYRRRFASAFDREA